MPKIIIDLSAVQRNAEKVAKIAPPIAVIKDDAYGHGSIEVARQLSGIAQCFAVSTLSEAEALTNHGIKDDILVLCPSRYPLRQKSIIYTVSSKAEVDRLCRFFTPRLAIKINTGMNRFGVEPKNADALLSYSADRATIHSVYSHLRQSDCKELAKLQLDSFNFATRNMSFPKHLVASCGLLCGSEYYFDGVRCGLALYGGCDGYEQAMSVIAPMLEVRNIRAGEGVGYGNLILNKNARIAVIGIGYADGYRRLTAPRFVFIGGARCEVISVCMDVCFAVLPDSAMPDDEAEIMGKHISVDELAASYGTITYEVFTSFGKNKEKHFYGQNRTEKTL